MQRIIYFLILFLCGFVDIYANEVNVYIWTGYLPDVVIQQFTKETGIKVNLTEFDSNETLYTKLKAAPKAGYDVIVPSSYYVDRMRRQGMLREFNSSQLSNFKYLDHTLLNKPFDPNNKYSVPYIWGTTGIVVNKKYIDPNKVKGWQDLWNPAYRDKLLILDDVREVFAVGLMMLGYSGNDTDPKHIYEAYVKLKSLLPNIMLFNSDAERNIYIDEDSVIGMGWNGDIHMAQQENKDLVYIYPKEGFVVWIDCLAIAKNAPHVDEAMKLINFIMRPDIAKEISAINHYASPNVVVINLAATNSHPNPVIYPSKNILQRGEFQKDVGDAIEIYAKYWELLKIGG